MHLTKACAKRLQTRQTMANFQGQFASKVNFTPSLHIMQNFLTFLKIFKIKKVKNALPKTKILNEQSNADSQHSNPGFGIKLYKCPGSPQVDAHDRDGGGRLQPLTGRETV